MPTTKPQVLPTVYEAGHFFAVPETRGGQRLKLLVDTGGGGAGGMYWVDKKAAQRLHLKPIACTADGEHPPVVHLPDYRAGFGLPPPAKRHAALRCWFFRKRAATTMVNSVQVI